LGNFLESATTFSPKPEILNIQAENFRASLESKFDDITQSKQKNYKHQYNNHQDNHNNKIDI
jgi:hypothetical protein